MPCLKKPNPSAGCDGPFTNVTPCTFCSGVETNHWCLLKVAVSPRCDGPFAADPAHRCQFCKNLEGLTSPATRTWRQGVLGTITGVDLKQIYGTTEKATPGQIGVKLEESHRPDLCPWVEIGNLYVSLTVTGKGSWGSLVDTLCSRNLKALHFAVLTGRHGHPEGTLVDNLQDHMFNPLVPDAKHITQDKEQKPIVMTRNNTVRPAGPIDIELWNVATTGATATEKATMAKTQWLSAESLVQGKIVIWAWCYSLLSLYELTVLTRSQYSSPADYLGFNVAVSETVKNYFGWVNTHMEATLFKEQIARGPKYVKEYAAWRRVAAHV